MLGRIVRALQGGSTFAGGGVFPYVNAEFDGDGDGQLEAEDFDFGVGIGAGFGIGKIWRL